MTDEDWLDWDYCLMPLLNSGSDEMGEMGWIWKDITGGQGIIAPQDRLMILTRWFICS
jgi:hypothetical protein